MLLFGRFADIAGWRERDVEAMQLSALTRLLSHADGRLGEALALPGAQVAVNQTIVRGDCDLVAEDEVAYLPAMSGG